MSSNNGNVSSYIDKAGDLSPGGVIALILAAVAGLTFLSVLFIPVIAVFYLLAWNLGVVGFAAALGLTVTTVSYWTCLGGVVFLRIFKKVLGSIGRYHIPSTGGSS